VFEIQPISPWRGSCCAAVGWELKKKAGKKRVTLDLGGNAGLIVHHDADLAYAALLFEAYEELQVGGVVVGDVPTFRMDHMPYGGVKDSGLGREGVRYAIEEMTERKLLAVNLR